MVIHSEPSKDKSITWHRILHPPETPCGISLIHEDRNKLIDAWNSRPTEAKKKCYWTDQSDFDMGTYETSCKEMWAFTQDGIKENGITYCPFCGCTIVEVEK